MKKATMAMLTIVMFFSIVCSMSVFAASDKEQTSLWAQFENVFYGTTTDDVINSIGVQYRAHIQDVGFFPDNETWITGPEQIGTPGLGRRIEGVQLELTGQIPEGARIAYNLHVQDYGWLYDQADPTTWQVGPNYAGTQGEGKRIEAIQIELLNADGSKLEGYSVSYNAHIQNVGNVSAVADGEILGTVGAGQRLEALSVEVTKIENQVDLSAYEAALAAVQEADYTPELWSVYQTVVTANRVTIENTQEEVDAATTNIVGAQAALVKVAEPAEINSLSATGAKTIEVAFNRPVETEAAAFAVIRGLSTEVSIASVSWNDEKTVAELSLSARLNAATYTVNVSGLSEVTLTASVTTEAETVTAIEMMSDLAVLQKEETVVTVGYKVLNQYGEDITGRTSTDSANMTATASGGAAVELDKETGLATITNPDSEFEVGDTLILTIIYEETALVGSKKLTVSDEAGVSEIAFGDVYNVDGLALSMDNADEEFYLGVSARDQYGDTLDADFLNDADIVRAISNDDAVLELEIDDTNKFIDLDTDDDGEDETTALKMNITGEGQAKISIISLLDGTKASKELTVAAATEVNAITLSQPDLAVVGEKVTIPYEAIDTSGNAVTTLPELSAGVSLSVSLGGGLEDDPDSPVKASFKRSSSTGVVSLKLDLTNVVDADNNGGTATIVAITAAGESTKLKVTIEEAATIVGISGVTSDIDLNPAIGGTSEIDCDGLEFIDQYDRSIDIDSDYSVKIAVDDTAIANVATTEPDEEISTPGATAMLSSEGVVTLTGVANGSTPITFTIYINGTEVAGSEYETKVKVADTGEYASYTIGSMNPVYDSSTSDYKTSLYTRSVKVYGVLASGTQVELSTDDYAVNFTGQDGLVSTKKSDYWKLTVATDAAIDYPDGATEVQGKVTVIINDTGDTLEKNVTISKAAPKVSTVAFTSGTGKVSSGGYTLAADHLNFETVMGLLSASSSYDSYKKPISKFSTTGATMLNKYTEAAYVTISDIEDADDEIPLTIENNGTNVTEVTNIETGDSFKVTISFANGASGSFNVYADVTQNTALEAINDATSASKTGTILKTYATGLGIDLTDYNNLGSTYKTAVNTAVYNDGKNYADVASVQAVFNQAVAEQSAAEAEAAIAAATEKVAAYISLDLGNDENIAAAVASQTDDKEGATAAVDALSSSDSKTSLLDKISQKDDDIALAATVATVSVVPDVLTIGAALDSTQIAEAVLKNAAGVELNSALAGTYAVTYNWTATSDVGSLSVTNEKVATIMVTEALETSTTVSLGVTITQGALQIDADDVTLSVGL